MTTMTHIYSMYGTPIPCTASQKAAIMAFLATVQPNIGMGNLQPAPAGVTVRYTHTYGVGGAQIFFNGSQIASR